jgi:hypothetical protein
LKDAPGVQQDFARSANSLRWLRGPYKPDIRTITVSRTRRNVLRFAIRFRNPVSLTSRTKLQLLLDTDQNARTGVQGGEYALDYSGNPPSPMLLKATAGQVHASTPPTLAFSATPTSATFRINARYIGRAAAFRFWVFTVTGQSLDDVAPSEDLDSAYAHVPPIKEWNYRRYKRRTYNNP